MIYICSNIIFCINREYVENIEKILTEVRIFVMIYELQ